MPGLERVSTTRIAARPDALDQAVWPTGLIVLRTAPDEALVVGSVDPTVVTDPHAIIAPDTGWFGVWLSRPVSTAHLTRHCRWAWPETAGQFAQGAVAGLPVKLWVEPKRVLWLVPEAFAAEFEARLP